MGLLEMVSCARRLIPQCYEEPLREGTQYAGDWLLVDDPLDPNSRPDWGSLVETPLDENAVNGARDAVHQGGTEALGWYQPHHSYDDHSWGIYLYAPHLQALGQQLHGLLAEHPGAPAHLAWFLVTLFVTTHERFHAAVEHFVLNAEFMARQARYRSYLDHVYNVDLRASGAIEEALANYQAMAAVRASCKKQVASGAIDQRHADVIDRWFTALLADSPPGYRDYMLGSDAVAWRRLANHSAYGRAVEPVDQAPFERELRLGVSSFSASNEIPVFVVTGSAYAALLRLPPQKLRDIQYFLRRKDYEPDRQSGSHTVWKHRVTGRTLPAVPAHSEVSIGVLKQLLDELGVTFRDYRTIVRG